MKNLSKLLAALVCAALIFALAACSSNGNETTTTTAPAGQETESTQNDSSSAPVDGINTADLTDDETDEPTDEDEENTADSSDPHAVVNKTKFDTTKHVFVTFTVKDFGEFQVELYPEYAPNTVTNFVNLADSGYFDGTKFHRVVDNFMVQGGDNSEVDVEPIYGEFSSNGFEKNTLKHERGVISMARTTEPDSATGQFFICNSDTVDFLDGNYAAFGRVTYGMDVIDSFCEVERSMNSLGELAVPMTDIIIEKTTVSQ